MRLYLTLNVNFWYSKKCNMHDHWIYPKQTIHCYGILYTSMAFGIPIF